MQITIVTGPFLLPPPGPAGAVEKIWAKLATEFAAAGHEVTLVSRAYPGLCAAETVNGVRCLRRSGFQRTGCFPVDLLKDLLYSLAILRSLPSADITVTNAFWLPVFASFLSRAGIIYINVQRFPKGQMRLYWRAAVLSAPSQAVRNAVLSEWPGAAPRLRTIPNPYEDAVFQPPAEPRASAGPQTILYAGRLHPEKGLELLIRAFAILSPRYPHLCLKLLGPVSVRLGGGGERYRRHLAGLAAGMPISFADPISDPHRLADEYRAAHVFCYPSLAERGESFPVAPLEAMATGLAPVVSSLDCFRDFVIDGETGLFFDHRATDAPARLASQLESLVSSPDRARRLGTAAVAKAAEFSMRNVAAQFLSDFGELVHTHSGDPNGRP
ncbi:MAG: glycosyltransferase family 4 protein [Bryobacteraceae bacterium]|jgi:glycosyltransferase involved in cell wall biosynthesis